MRLGLLTSLVCIHHAIPLQKKLKKAIPFRLALRLRRICSTDATFNTRAAQLTTYLLKRGYNGNFVTKQIRRASDIPRRLTLQTKDVNKPKTHTDPAKGLLEQMRKQR